MSDLAFVLLTLGIAGAIIAVVFVLIECHPPTPFDDDSAPPLLNLLALIAIWLPLLLVAIPVAITLRLTIPARHVNTTED